MEGEILCCLALLLPILFLSYLIIFKPKNINSRRQSGKNLPPSPPSLPIIGHLHLLKSPYHRSLESLSKRYGPVLFLRFGQQPFVVVSSPQMAEQCFTQNDIALANRPKFLAGQHIGYNFSTVAWAPYGDYWRNLRKAMTIEALSSHRIHQSSWIRQEEIRLMVRDLVSTAEGTKVNMTRLFNKLMHDLVMKMLNGEKWDESRKDFFLPLIMNVCDFVPLLRWVGYKGLERDMKKLQRSRDEFLQGLLDQGRKRDKLVKEDNGAKKKRMVEQLLHLQQSNPEQYTDEILKGIIARRRQLCNRFSFGTTRQSLAAAASNGCGCWPSSSPPGAGKLYRLHS